MAQDQLDIACRPGPSPRVADGVAGLADAVAWLRSLGVPPAVPEATGGLETPAAAALATAPPVAVVNLATDGT